ncbi:hypothetical protein F0L68_04855 [Solihabitans fulvus]|uniref:DUF385 domain-containing protein n=1 Tax=Solihabitans fulvus TaxID=1892852 RepID=A0A5B2XRE2_9PSEU|nr:hypothetical protein [Solihabitans fulvus]KAA2265409.1 hypothetical protein F0L68_04855 [Solihabitans fulvus]
MGYQGPFFPKQAASRVNGCVTALLDSPRWGRVVSKRITTVTYTGRRSGRFLSTPVAYRRATDTVTIDVKLPEAKTWWRNFTGDGGPLSLQLNGTDRTGHAIAHRDEKGRVTVTVHLSD